MKDSPDKTSLAEHGIETGNARLSSYRLAHAYRKLVQKELLNMEEEGIIELPSGEWAAPILLVKKKDGYHVPLCGLQGTQ